MVAACAWQGWHFGVPIICIEASPCGFTMYRSDTYVLDTELKHNANLNIKAVLFSLFDRAHTLMAILISYHFYVSLILNHVKFLNTIQQSTNKAIIDTQANLLLQKQVGWKFLPLREKKEKQRETKTKVNEIHQFVKGKTAISNALWLHRSSGRDMI